MFYTFTHDNLSDNDIKQIAMLHIKYLETGFLSQLGSGFLFYLYKSIHESRETVLIAANHNDEVIGFVAGAIGLKSIYKLLIKRHLFGVMISVLPKLFSLSRIKKIIEIISYSGNNKKKIIIRKMNYLVLL